LTLQERNDSHCASGQRKSLAAKATWASEAPNIARFRAQEPQAED